MLNDGHGYEYIIKNISRDDFFDEKFVKNFIREQLDVFKERDKECDTQMYDYVEQFVQQKICFHAFNHPHNFIIKELVLRILKYFKIEDLTFSDEERFLHSEKLRSQGQPIYPSVLKALGLTLRQDNSYCVNKNVVSFDVPFEEYIRMYYNAYLFEPITFDVWGSSVSSEIFMYDRQIKIGSIDYAKSS